MKKYFILFILIGQAVFALSADVLDGYRIDKRLSTDLQKIVSELDLDGNFDVGEDGIEQISLTVIDISRSKPRLGGVNEQNFIYPASVYKMYVAAEILHQISDGRLSLTTPYVVESPNDVDRSKEISSDPRPLLRDGDTVTVNYLLDLMITRSDNSAANCLIDIAQRKNINALIHAYHWNGSEVTRKYLSRKYEDAEYKTVRGTETCSLHAADFMYRVYTDQLVNPWVSMQMKALLGRQLDNSKFARGLPAGSMFYHKTGWYSYWTNDVGIVDDGKIRYIVACFLPLREELAKEKYADLSKRIDDLIRMRNK